MSPYPRWLVRTMMWLAICTFVLMCCCIWNQAPRGEYLLVFFDVIVAVISCLGIQIAFKELYL